MFVAIVGIALALGAVGEAETHPLISFGLLVFVAVCLAWSLTRYPR